MAKHAYEELEVDEHDIATHWLNRNGIECWAWNEYKPDGCIKNVHQSVTISLQVYMIMFNDVLY